MKVEYVWVITPIIICDRNLLTWFNFNPSMDKNSHQLKCMGWNYLSIIKCNGATAEDWEWISNFIPHFTGHVITYPCWDWSWTMLVKGATWSLGGGGGRGCPYASSCPCQDHECMMSHWSQTIDTRENVLLHLKSWWLGAIECHTPLATSVQLMTWHRSGAKLHVLLETMLRHCQLDP